METTVKLEAVAPKAAEGQRVVEIHYRISKNNKTKRPSVFAVVPKLEAPEVVAPFQSIVTAVLEEMQDSIIAEAAEEKKLELALDAVSLDACLKYWQQQAVSKRLNGEQIGQWYDDSATAAAVAEASAKYDDVKALALIKLVRETFQKLAAPVPPVSKDAATKLLHYWAEADNATPIGRVIKGKLDAIVKTDDAALFESL